MATIHVGTEIAAEPQAVYDVVADLPGHARWSADPLEIEPVDGAPVGPGKRYRSSATSKGTAFTADLTVTAAEPPRRFAFTAVDATGRWKHEFTVRPAPGGATVERVVTGELTLGQRLLFALVYLPVKRPSARLALSRLKAQLESGSG